jgi:hypothetical protein
MLIDSERLRWKVTELCVLRAWSRGRHHGPNVEESQAWHTRIAERAAKDYPCRDATATESEATSEHREGDTR